MFLEGSAIISEHTGEGAAPDLRLGRKLDQARKRHQGRDETAESDCGPGNLFEECSVARFAR
jgi:hypothetical protein